MHTNQLKYDSRLSELIRGWFSLSHLKPENISANSGNYLHGKSSNGPLIIILKRQWAWSFLVWSRILKAVLNRPGLFCSLFWSMFFRQWISRVFGEGNQSAKEKCMSNNNKNRVLSRMGARQLTANEIEQVAAAKLTFASVLITAPVSNPDESFDQ